MGKHRLPSPDVLRKLYIDQNLTSTAIAKMYEVSPHAVTRKLASHGIRKGRQTPWLEKKRLDVPNIKGLQVLLDRGLTVAEMTRVYGVSNDTIKRILSDNDMKPNDHDAERVIDEGFLRFLYQIEGFPASEIASAIGVSGGTIARYLKKYDISARGRGRPKKENVRSFKDYVQAESS